MRMASYDQIRSRVYISLSQDTLVLFRRFISFDSPMYKYNDMIIPGVGFRDPLVQKRRIIGLEQSGLRVGGIPFVCWGDSGRAQKSKGLPVNGTDGGRRSLGDVITAADTGDISLLKSIQGVAEGILPEIQSVVICHCDDIYAQVLEDADVFWICAESKLFVWHRFSPQAERKFFVQQKQI